MCGIRLRSAHSNRNVSASPLQACIIRRPLIPYRQSGQKKYMEMLFEFVGNHPFLVSAFVILLLLFIRNEAARGGESVSPQELVNLVNKEAALVLDVREIKEFADGHIVKSVNIPHGALAQRITELNKHKDKPLIVACKMGQHSGAAGTLLRKAGFQNVKRLKGGIGEWRSQNLPVVKG